MLTLSEFSTWAVDHSSPLADQAWEILNDGEIAQGIAAYLLTGCGKLMGVLKPAALRMLVCK